MLVGMAAGQHHRQVEGTRQVVEIGPIAMTAVGRDAARLAIAHDAQVDRRRIAGGLDQDVGLLIVAEVDVGLDDDVETKTEFPYRVGNAERPLLPRICPQPIEPDCRFRSIMPPEE
jgi:hypothetical protein